MSHAIASESPAPAAGPRTIAMVGLGHLRAASATSSMRLRSAWAFSSIVWAAQPRCLGHGLDVAAPRRKAAPGAGSGPRRPTAGSSARARQSLQQGVEHRARTWR